MVGRETGNDDSHSRRHPSGEYSERLFDVGRRDDGKIICTIYNACPTELPEIWTIIRDVLVQCRLRFGWTNEHVMAAASKMLDLPIEPKDEG